MEYITSEGKELVDRLIKTGLNKNQAKALLAIAKEESVTSREIEDHTSLRQPEASIAINELREKGWVSKGKKNKEGRGRPVHIYSLDKDFSAILKKIEEEEKEKIQEIKDNIQKLRESAEKEGIV